MLGAGSGVNIRRVTLTSSSTLQSSHSDIIAGVTTNKPNLAYPALPAKQ